MVDNVTHVNFYVANYDLESYPMVQPMVVSGRNNKDRNLAIAGLTVAVVLVLVYSKSSELPHTLDECLILIPLNFLPSQKPSSLII